ncbi:MAG TPA: hypothetical protein VF637_12700 [Sphingomicrobium sp.]
MTKLTWLGDSDPAATDIQIYGYSFAKGEAVNVTDKKLADKLATNPMFSTEAKAEAAPAEEPTAEEVAERAEQGTVKGALKARLKELGVSTPGNPSEDTLRDKLAATLRDQSAQ